MDKPIEIIEPETKEKWLFERSKDVTSTESSALFGLNLAVVNNIYMNLHLRLGYHLISTLSMRGWTMQIIRITFTLDLWVALQTSFGVPEGLNY